MDEVDEGSRQAGRESHFLFAGFPEEERAFLSRGTSAFLFPIDEGSADPSPASPQPGPGDPQGVSDVSQGRHGVSLLVVRPGAKLDLAATSFPGCPVRLYTKTKQNKKKYSQ